MSSNLTLAIVMGESIGIDSATALRLVKRGGSMAVAC
jgi:hypothetical protein